MGFSERVGYYITCKNCNNKNHRVYDCQICCYFDMNTKADRFECFHCGSVIEIRSRKSGLVGFGYTEIKWDNCLR